MLHHTITGTHASSTNTDGHYLTVVPTSKADSPYRIIFETDGKRVLNYRAGIRPQVEYVEGCS
jgi:hypothetical protein